jgi:hypothetical protein
VRRLPEWGGQSLRGLAALADAFNRVADRTQRVSLGETLRGRCDQIEVSTTLYALRSLIDLACHQTGETPRTLLEAEFMHAPSDDYWRANLEAA